jgi:putative acetyltransferase
MALGAPPIYHGTRRLSAEVTMDAGLRIRPVEARDVPAVVGLVAEVLAEFGLTFGLGSGTDAELSALPGCYTDKGGAFWVVEDETGALVGTCGVSPVEDGVLELRKMYLVRSTRGRGVGRALMDRALAFARETGARRVVLDTTEEMTGAIRLYEASGFRRDDAQVRGSRCSRGYVLELGEPRSD